jgi:CheY-like chemotaxis protein
VIVDEEDAIHGAILAPAGAPRRTNADKNFGGRPASAVLAAADDRGVRVLVIDDSARLRERLALRLGERGHLVVGEADTAAVALALALELRPDAIIADVLLRDRHRLELVIALRTAMPAALLVILTNAASYRDHCLALGADRFLDKSAAFDSVAELLTPRAEPRG